MKSNEAWAVVQVWRGLADAVELFADEQAARERESELRAELRDEDDLRLFEVALPAALQQ